MIKTLFLSLLMSSAMSELRACELFVRFKESIPLRASNSEMNVKNSVGNLFGDSLAISQNVTPAYDPLFDDSVELIPTNERSNWSGYYIWYPGQLAAYQQAQQCEYSKDRCVNVGYPGKFFLPSPIATFQSSFDTEEPVCLSWSNPGKSNVLLDGVVVEQNESRLTIGKGSHSLVFTIETVDSLPCLLLSGPADIIKPEHWQVSIPGYSHVQPEWSDKYRSPQFRPDSELFQTAIIPPAKITPIRNAEHFSSTSISIGKNGTLLVDFRHIEVGSLVFKASGHANLHIRVGETPEEALNQDPKLFEQHPLEELVLDSESWAYLEASERAFRYAVIESDAPAVIDSIKFKAKIWPVDLGLDFRCDDQKINDMFEISRATLHTSMHNFYLDGVKRDYLPWAMDAIVSSLAGDYLFGDKQVSRNGISVSLLPPCPTQKDLGVTDYPFHALIGIKHYLNRYGDDGILAQYRPRILELLHFYDSIGDERGFIKGSLGTAGFIPGWSTKNGPQARGYASYPQIMLYCNFLIGADLCSRLGENVLAVNYRKKARFLKKNIIECFWDEERKAFINGTDNKGELDKRISHHAQYWAVLAGLYPEKYFDMLFDELLPSLPFYFEDVSYEKGYEMLAYAKARKTQRAWDFLDTVFGDWMRQGHVRFPENFSPQKNRQEQLVFYGRPFGLSLCHGANGVPVTIWILNNLLGFQQSQSKPDFYEITPNLLHLNQAYARIPVREGEIILDLKSHGTNTVTIPDGCVVKVALKGMRKSVQLRQGGTYTFETAAQE